MKWKFIETDPALIERFKQELKINEILARVLINRNIDLKTADTILNRPQNALLDPMGIVNMEEGVRKIIEHVENEAEIWIFADYDVDGIMSGYVMTDFLRKTTNNPVYVYYPNRAEGYGLNIDFCKLLKERKETEQIADMLVITVDNGTACCEEIEFLKQNGIDVVVTDHHKPKDQIPRCPVINPHISDDPTYYHLAGCGVAFKTIQAIQQMVGMSRDYAEAYLFAVALGTIADVMPMTPENIAIVKLGLQQFKERKCPKGFAMFLDALGEKDVSPESAAWNIAPKLNACGRVGDINTAASLFFADDNTPEDEIYAMIETIKEADDRRKELIKEAMKEAEKMNFEHDEACVFHLPEYPVGISGIIANKLAEKYNKPALVMTGKKILSGSARSPEGLNLQAIFNKEDVRKNLASFGGHEQAAGFKVFCDKLDALKESLNKEIPLYIETCGIEVAEPEIVIDGIVSFNLLNKETYIAVQSLPYDNAAFPQPIFCIKNLAVEKIKSSGNNQNNICLTLKDENGQQKSIWAWGMGEKYEEIGRPKTIDIAGKITYSLFMGQYTMDILDLRKAE